MITTRIFIDGENIGFKSETKEITRKEVALMIMELERCKRELLDLKFKEAETEVVYLDPNEEK
jgi:hypothetical protein